MYGKLMGSWWPSSKKMSRWTPTMSFPWPRKPCTFCFLFVLFVSSSRDIGSHKDSEQRRTSSRIRASILESHCCSWFQTALTGGSHFGLTEPSRILLMSRRFLISGIFVITDSNTCTQTFLEAWEKSTLNSPSVSLILKMTFKLICFAGCLICERGCKLWIMSLSSSWFLCN